MQDETVLMLSCPPDRESRSSIEDLALSLIQTAKQLGGAAWAGWVDNGLKVRVQNITDEDLRSTIQAWINAAQRDQDSFQIIEQKTLATLLPDSKAAQMPWGTLVRAKLTKKLLNQLPEGAFVISNCFRNGYPIFEQKLGPTNRRDTSWKLAMEAGANNRLCRVAWTVADLEGPKFSPATAPRIRNV